MKEELSVKQVVLPMIAAYMGAFAGFNVPLFFWGLAIMPFTSDWNIRLEYQNCLVIVLIIFMLVAAVAAGITCYAFVYKLLSKTKFQEEVLDNGDVEKVGEELSVIQIVLPKVASFIGTFVGFLAPLFFWACITETLQHNLNIKSNWGIEPEHQKWLLMALILFMLIVAPMIGRTCARVVRIWIRIYNKLSSETIP
ncbi:MAG: hypothetical protein LBL39_08005 [Planctomycetaceae bacterium]|jgi:uncharacterized membrane protein|nr:hypothetical protein [Planctomycetaceae bacterium]